MIWKIGIKIVETDKVMAPITVSWTDAIDDETVFGKAILRDTRTLYEIAGMCDDTDVPHRWHVKIMIEDENGQVSIQECAIPCEPVLDASEKEQHVETGGIYYPWDTLITGTPVSVCRDLIKSWLIYPVRRQILWDKIEEIKTVPRYNGWDEKKIRARERDLLTGLIYRWLQPFGVEKEICDKIAGEYGPMYRSKIAHRCYDVCMDLGLSFPQADHIAKSLNVYDPWGYGLTLSLRTWMINRGDTVVSSDDMIAATARLTRNAARGYSTDPAAHTTLYPEMWGRCHIDGDDELGYCDPDGVRCEKGIAHLVKRLTSAASPAVLNPEQVLVDTEKRLGLTLGNDQKAAFVGVMSQKGGINIITGGPGTGKTLIAKALIDAYEHIYPQDKIKLCAPTGRAAQRLAESTGREATTIHKMLDFLPYTGAPRITSGWLQAGLLIVDETSMIDIALMRYLLDATPKTATVVLLGDKDQLESVGQGAVLRDMIASEHSGIKKYTLTEIYRQADGSKIVTNAVKIRTGDVDLEVGEDFSIVKSESGLMTVDIVRDIMRKSYNPDDPYAVQVLCPSKKGDSGVRQLNNALQEALNPAEDNVRVGMREYRLGDKVMMTRNNYAAGYYNGDIGTIADMTDTEMTIDVRGEQIIVKRDDWDDVTLAYATTIHKAQGSEFETVVIALSQDAPGMLIRNLLYTAVTRAKKRVIVVTEGDAMAKAIAQKSQRERRTSLLHWLESGDK